MKKSMLIIGAGTGLSQAVAKKFAAAGYSIYLISRSQGHLETIKQALIIQGINISYAAADAGDAQQLTVAIQTLSAQSGGFEVVLYNAAVLKAQDILQETAESLTQDFTINVAGALRALQLTLPDLQQNKGGFLLTGGGLALQPSAEYGSLSIGKAGIRSLAYQLHDRLKESGVYVGLLTVAGFIRPDSITHSPALLADLFWRLYQDRTTTEFNQ